MNNFSRTPPVKKRLNANQKTPYQKEVQQKDKILEEQLLQLFLGMDIYFKGMYLLVEDLDTRMQTFFKEETLKQGITLQASDDHNTIIGLVL